MEKNYSIGLDLGTSSIGWAVINNEDFTLCKKKGKSMWGVFLFEEGKTAKDRRIFRTARRRTVRRRERIELLRYLLGPAVNEIDDCFFKRLDASFLLTANKDSTSSRTHRFNLFNGDFTDKDYYKRFPTIYHLRKHLCETTEKEDIRLVYLALHHIIKYRGNFLHNEKRIQVEESGIIEKLNEVLTDNADVLDAFCGIPVDTTAVCAILQTQNKTASDKAKEIKKHFGDNNFGAFVGKVLCGLKGNTKKAFTREDEELSDDVKDLQFSKEDFEANLEENAPHLGEEITTFINSLYAVYMEKTCVDILGQHKSISDAMIAKYEKHKHDLADLKALLSPYRDLYVEMFVSKKKNRSTKASYSNYVRINTKTDRYGKTKTGKEEFYKFTKDLLANVEDCPLKTKILTQIELGKFMPKINDVENGAIPYQINLNELEQIINNQSKYYPALEKEKGKIIDLLTFRRPYYVGPLKGKFSWITQEINEKVYPWNFEKLVDYTEARQNFIKNLVENDKVTNTAKLPLQSITYQKYIVLNELNNLRFKGLPLPVEIKQKLYNDLVLAKNKITIKDIYKFLKDHFGMYCDTNTLKGFSDEKILLGNMKTYREFKNILGENFTEKDIQLYDKAVEVLTVFSDFESKKLMLTKLFKEKKYTEENIKGLCKKSYAGWGKFSYEHLAEKPFPGERYKSMLTLLYETNQNYMSILYDDQYGFKEKFIKEIEHIEKITYDSVIDDLFASPAVKKATWQAVKLVEEIKKIMGSEPKYIFIESTRKPDEKKRTKKRIDKISDLLKAVEIDDEYNAIKKDLLHDCNETKRKLAQSSEERLKDEKLYLYMMQLGRCMYTGKPLDIERLSEYEVDHIIPRCFIKDDSIENKVLVVKEANQRKSNLAITEDVIQKMQVFWKFLLDNKFITAKKYTNLTKRQWTENDLHGFINRQLVETSQTNKIVQNVLQSTNKTAIIKPLKAAIVTELRKERTNYNPQTFGNFFKLRDLNDLHHAKDAYLVAILGVFTNDIYNVWGNDEKAFRIKKLLEKKSFDSRQTNELVNKRYGVIIDQLMIETIDYETGEVINLNQACNNIFETMDRNDIFVVVKKEFEGETQFYNQTLYSESDPKSPPRIPRGYTTDKNGNKVSLPLSYGGYSGSKQIYYVNVEYSKGKKRVEKLVGVPVLTATEYANGDKNAILKMLEDEGYTNPVVDDRTIYYNQLIKMKGQKVLIRSANEVCNATQLIVDRKFHQMLRYIEKDNLHALERMENFSTISKEFLFQYLEKMEKFFPLFDSIKDKVQAFVQTKFDSLTNAKKAEYIKKLLVITKSGASRVDMGAELGGGSSLGRLAGKTIVKSEVEWIDQSMTGIYVNKIPAKK